MNEVSDIDDDMHMWQREFRKYFKVNKFDDYSPAIQFMKRVICPVCKSSDETECR